MSALAMARSTRCRGSVRNFPASLGYSMTRMLSATRGADESHYETVEPTQP